MIDFKWLRSAGCIDKYKKAILKVDGTMSYVPIDWGKTPEVDRIIKDLMDRWLKAKQKRATKRLRLIIKECKQHASIHKRRRLP